MVELRLNGLTKTYTSPPITAVSPTNLTIEHGEFFTLVGPSGCGKSTMLRMIAGLETPTDGEIYFDDEPVTDLPPQQRDIAMVFQNIALFPHMTVRDNIGYGLKVRNKTENINDKIKEAAEMLNIKEHLDKKPNQLSGGQQQRVALGRAIVRDPNLLLLDEPMSDLDANLKAKLRVIIQELHQDLDTTMIYVTHDQREAMTMSTQVGLLRDGEFAQIDSPDNLYDYPETEFSAQFIGQPATNIITVPIDELGLITMEDSGNTVRQLDVSNNIEDITDEIRTKGQVNIGFRPQDVTLTEDWKSCLMTLQYHLYEQDGNEFNIHTTSMDGADITAVHYEKPDFERESRVGIDEINRLYIFDPETGEKLTQLQSDEFDTRIHETSQLSQ